MYMKASISATIHDVSPSRRSRGTKWEDTGIARKIVCRSPSSQLISQTKIKQPTKDLVYFSVRIFLWLIDHDVPSRVSFVDKGIARESSGLSHPPREARRRIRKDWQESVSANPSVFASRGMMVHVRVARGAAPPLTTVQNATYRQTGWRCSISTRLKWLWYNI